MSSKIICTIGPKTLNRLSLHCMADAGMSMVRLNGVHADIRWHTEAIDLVRKILPKMPILFDLPTFRIARWQIKSGKRITEKGEIIGPQDRRRVALARQCEYVAASYIEKIDELGELRDRIPDRRIIAKIETAQGLRSVEEIGGACDYLMLDRRDIAIDVGWVNMASVQSEFLKQPRTIVASELLSSMLNHNGPSIADVIGITELAKAGADYLLLSEETAVGDRPIEAVGILKRVIEASQ